MERWTGETEIGRYGEGGVENSRLRRKRTGRDGESGRGR